MALALIACARPAGHQYHEAVARLREGDTHAYYDAMVRLAADAPGERAGRRARATLLGGEATAGVALARLVRGPPLALETAPDGEAPAAEGEGPEGSGPVDPSREPVAQMRAIAAASHAFKERHGRFCRDFNECTFEPPAPAHYFYFVGEHAVAGGSDSQRTVEAEGQIRAWLAARHLFVEAGRQRFRVVAVGLIGDVGVDVWTLDEAGRLVHLNEEDASPPPAKRRRGHPPRGRL